MVERPGCDAHAQRRALSNALGVLSTYLFLGPKNASLTEPNIIPKKKLPQGGTTVLGEANSSIHLFLLNWHSAQGARLIRALGRGAKPGCKGAGHQGAAWEPLDAWFEPTFLTCTAAGPLGVGTEERTGSDAEDHVT